VQRRLERALDLCARALHETRHLARLLRPKILDDLGLSAALHWLCRSVSDSAGVAIDIDCDEDSEQAQGDAATLVFRLAQEALNNVAKHARAEHVLVKVSVHDGRLHLLIADDGRGFDPERVLAPDQTSLSTGLGSMRERVALFGGSMTLVSAPGEGTQVRAILPLDNITGEA
jgi:signal transduction histidine kinase